MVQKCGNYSKLIHCNSIKSSMAYLAKIATDSPALSPWFSSWQLIEGSCDERSLKNNGVPVCTQSTLLHEFWRKMPVQTG
jgi:hypothetical protein